MSSLECGIVILPPADLAASIVACQRAADPAFVPSYPPHITVKALFYCLADDTSISAAIDRVCRRRSPFTIAFNGLRSFSSPGGHILYLAVRPTAALRSLHAGLLRALAPLTILSESVAPGYEGAAYTPHLTVLSSVPDGRLEAARAAATCLSTADAFVAAEVALICRPADEPAGLSPSGAGWLPPHTFALGRKNAVRPDPDNPICDGASGEAG